MKKIKKLVAIALAAVMVFALGSVAFAGMTGDTPSSTDTGTITINDLEGGVIATAYPIAKATYDADGNFLGYAMVSGTEGCAFQISADGSYEESALTEENLAALFEAVSASEEKYSATVDVNGTSATIENVPVGAYLIVITGSESTAYGMMIGSVSYTTEGGDWAIDNGAITDVADCELWAKSTKPTVEKTEHHENGDATHGESADVGDEIIFDIEVHSIPSYQGEYPEFDVTDQLTGLVMNTDEIEGIKITAYPTEESTEGTELTLGTDYTVTPIYATPEDPTSDIVGFDVNFVVEGNYMLNSYAGGYLVIEYGAILTDEGVSYNGDALHENDVTLTYATTSYVAGTEESPNEGTDEDTDYEYTFAVNAMKTDNSDETALAGATFGLYTDDACTTPYTRDDAALTATSGADGTFAFSGLEAGTYYMKEIEAPAGYLLNQAVYKVVISAEYNTDGTITSWTITVTLDGDTVASVTNGALTDFSIQNTKTGILPSTGGRGTLIFTIIGCAIVVCAVVGVVATRRRRAA